jgi:hypothetical protein
MALRLDGLALGVRLGRRRISPPEMVDMAFRVGNRGVGIGPRNSELKDRKEHAIDHDRRCIGAPDPGVPQIAASLEGFDVKTVIEMDHAEFPLSYAGTRSDHVSAKANVIWFTFAAFFPAAAN